MCGAGMASAWTSGTPELVGRRCACLCSQLTHSRAHSSHTVQASHHILQHNQRSQARPQARLHPAAAAHLHTQALPGRCGGRGRRAGRRGCGPAAARRARRTRAGAATSCAAGRRRCCAQRAPPVVAAGWGRAREQGGGSAGRSSDAWGAGLRSAAPGPAGTHCQTRRRLHQAPPGTTRPPHW